MTWTTKWVPISDFLGVMIAAQKNEWTWMRNMKCKYVELRVDMRDGMCIIKDRHGNKITPKQLAYQLYADGEAAEHGGVLISIGGWRGELA